MAPPPPDPAPWRRQLQASLAALPPARRRQLRTYRPTPGAGLEPTPDPTPGGPPDPTAGGPTAPPLLDLASNDYLGLSRHPAVIAAAAAELQQGLGAGASRLVTGSRPSHQQLEQALAHWLGREQVLLFPSGFQANLAALTALADRHSLVLADRLIHHSLLVGVRASGAQLQRFRHNDLAHLQQLLQQARAQRPQQRILVLSESLFSMEGTSPPLAGLAQLCQHHGALLLLDEAHALGVLGPAGRGLAAGLANGADAVPMLSGTFGKAFGSGGAFLACDGLLGDWLLQHCGPYRYTTALAPPLAAGALAALAWIQQHPSAGPALLARAQRWRDALARNGWPRPPGEGPILPLLVGDDGRALALQQQLEHAGLLAIAIRPPTVPPGQARLRLVLRQDCPQGTLARLLTALGPGPLGSEPRDPGHQSPGLQASSGAP